MKITVSKAQNIPAKMDSYVEMRMNEKIEKTSRKTGEMNPVWNEMLMFHDVSINDSITFELKNYKIFTKSQIIGKSINLHLMRLMNEVNGKLGCDFHHTKKLFVNGRDDGCYVIISLHFGVGSKQEQKYEAEDVVERHKVLCDLLIYMTHFLLL